MRFLRRSLTGVFLLAVTLAILAFAGQTVVSAIQARMGEENRRPPAREREFSANVVTVEAQTVTPVLSTFGDIRARRTLLVRSRAAGRVVELAEAFEDGATVSQGDLLFRVDPSDAQAALDTARTGLALAEAELRDARRALELSRDDLAAAEAQVALREASRDRQKQVFDGGFGSAALVEETELALASSRQSVVSRNQALASAEARVEQAETQLEQQRITLREAERQLADTFHYAAFDGTLTGVTVVEGGIVTANEQVAQLIDVDDLEVSFRISTQQYTRLLDERGSLILAPVSVTLDVYGAALEARGKITRESASVAEGQTGRLVYATLDAPRGLLPGDFVTVRVEEPAMADVSILPATAVDAAQTVLALGSENRLEEVEVSLLRRQGDDVILRAPAALIGREVVAERSPLLGAGIKVRPVRSGEDAASQAAAEPEMLELTPERKAALIAFVQSNKRMPNEAKQRVLAELSKDRVPAQMVERLERRMGG